MFKVKLSLSNLSIPAKVAKARNIVTQMTGNIAYTTPNPSLANVTIAADELETAYNDAQDGAHSKKVIMYAKSKALSVKLTLLGAYVQEASSGDETKILSAGMEVRATPTPPQDLPAPYGLTASTGNNEGEIKLRWRPVPKSKTYLIQQSADGETNWENTNLTSTKANIVIAKLATATKIWFRVCAVGAKGNSPWSDPARGLVA